MNKKIKNIITVSLFFTLIFGLGILFMFKGNTEFSDAERRTLKPFPVPSFNTVLSGKYMKEFEDAAPDQFPFRDCFRTVKAHGVLNIFAQSDNNKIYYKKGHLSKIEYPINYDMLSHAADRFANINKTYLEGTRVNIYFSVVPDKNMFLSPQVGGLAIDYQALIDYMKSKTSYMQYIDVTHLLELSDYYRTDTHWRQERITDIAGYIAEKMGRTLYGEYNEKELEKPFYGVYHGQSALNVNPDTLVYLTNDILDNAVVTSYASGKPQKTGLYDMEKANGRDLYEVFLSGANPLVTIENPAAKTEKELVLFRDSFGSSIAPLLTSGYKKITVVDTRYIEPSLIGNFVKFDNQDVCIPRFC